MCFISRRPLTYRVIINRKELYDFYYTAITLTTGYNLCIRTLSNSQLLPEVYPPGSVGATEPCFLCEAPVDVKFEPCGHAVMCSECAQRARKCPTCKVSN